MAGLACDLLARAVLRDGVRRHRARRADLRRAGRGQPASLASRTCDLGRPVGRPDHRAALCGVCLARRAAARAIRPRRGRAAAGASTSGGRACSGAPIGVALWAILGFFNGISRPRITVMTSALVGRRECRAERGLHLPARRGHRRIRVGDQREHALRRRVRALRLPPGRPAPHAYKTHLTWRPDAAQPVAQFRLGLPMGTMYAADLFGLSLFQLMQVRLSQVGRRQRPRSW